MSTLAFPASILSLQVLTTQVYISLATCSLNHSAANVYDSTTHECIATLKGHEGEVTKVVITCTVQRYLTVSQAIFNPQGTRILTVSGDKTARLWDSSAGDCLQVTFLLVRLC